MFARRRCSPAAPPEPEFAVRPPDPEHVQVDELVMRVVRDAMRPGMVQFGAALPAPELLPTARINRILARVARENLPGRPGGRAARGHARAAHPGGAARVGAGLRAGAG